MGGIELVEGMHVFREDGSSIVFPHDFDALEERVKKLEQELHDLRTVLSASSLHIKIKEGTEP